jgi:hypothetical protein
MEVFMGYKAKLFVAILALLLLLAVTFPGCVEVVKQQPDSSPQTPATQSPPSTAPPSGAPEIPGQRPVVTAFFASPESIFEGQSVTLNWTVEGATQVVIQPYIGAVQPSGNRAVPLSNSTTFTLTATNASGNTMGKVTVMVEAPPAGVPDLMVTDIWVQGDIVYYKIANVGGIDSQGGESLLYVLDMEQDKDYIDPVPAGGELTGVFNNYAFQAPFGSEGNFGSATAEAVASMEVKVCVDVEDATKESDESNNCYTKMFGFTR